MSLDCHFLIRKNWKEAPRIRDLQRLPIATRGNFYRAAVATIFLTNSYRRYGLTACPLPDPFRSNDHRPFRIHICRPLELIPPTDDDVTGIVGTHPEPFEISGSDWTWSGLPMSIVGIGLGVRS